MGGQCGLMGGSLGSWWVAGFVGGCWIRGVGGWVRAGFVGGLVVVVC